MTYESATNHEARTLTGSINELHTRHKRASEKPSWILHREQIEALQKEMGMTAFTRMIEEEEQRRDWWRQNEED